MSSQERLDALAKTVALADPDDAETLSELVGCLKALCESLEEDVPASVASACAEALKRVEANSEGAACEEALSLVTELVTYAQDVFQTVERGGSADDVCFPEALGGPTDEDPDDAGEIDPEFLAMFTAGCEESLTELEGHLLGIEAGEGSDDSIAEVRRRIHTLKGECGVLSLDTAQQLCHKAEDLIDLCQEHGTSFPTDVLLALTDWLGRFVEQLSQDPRTRDLEHASILAQLEEATRAVVAGELAEQQTAESEQADAAADRGPATPEAGAPVDVPQGADTPQADGPRIEFDPALLDDPLVVEFLEESRQHLEDVEAALLEIEKSPENLDLVDRMFRAFHTIKGVAGFMHLEPMVEVAHTSETLLDEMRKGRLACETEYVNLIFQAQDVMEQLLTALSGGEAPFVATVEGVARAIARATSRAGDDAEEAADGPVIAGGDAPEASASEATGAESSPATVEPEKVKPKAAPEAPAPAAAAPKPASPSRGRSASRVESTVKVATQRLDSMVDLVGELVIAQQMVSQDPDLEALRSDRLNRNLSQVAKITRDLQEAAMSLRMVPLRTTFQKMARLVRDVSRKSGKQVALSIAGEDTELDRNVVEEIGDPLVHLIRNAIDHGIESPQERLAAGKSTEGNLDLRAYHRGGSIMIEIHDDGRGLDRQKILKKAVDRGLVPAETQAEDLPDSEIFKMIFLPGFSTAAEVTDISGRGVGMDVVRRNIEAMRGRVDIASTPGEGSVFTLRLPLTLAIIDGMIVRVGTGAYVLPTLSIEQSFRPDTGQLHSVMEGGEVVNVRGQMHPIMRLKDLFSLEDGVDDPTEAILLLLESNNARACLMVDEIVGQNQVVIKCIGKALPEVPGISGGAILGNGQVALIVDVDGVMTASGAAA